MFKFFYLVLSAAVMAARGERIIINGLLDHFLEQMNNHQRQAGATSAPFPEIPLSSEVKYSNAIFLGIDSIRRTADCWREVKGSDVSFDIHYGLRLMTIILPQLEVHEKNMSAYTSVGDNSVRIAFTMHFDHQKCNVTLDELVVERMEKVELRASRQEFDGLQLDSYFKMVVIPTLNSIVSSHFDQIEASLQIICKLKDYKDEADLQDVMSLFYD